MSNIILTGIGGYLPKNIIKNDDLNKSLNTNDAWIRKRTGITQRHISSDNETTSYMGKIASEKAIKNAKIDANDIDLIIVATSTPDLTFPSSAVKIQALLGIKNCTSFDIQAVCAGFVYAINIAESLMLSRRFNKALVIGSEVFSKILDWEDRSTCVLFGDGAGAVVLEKSNSPGWGILTTNIHSDGDYIDILQTDGGPATTGHVGKVRMNGKEVFKHAIEKLSSCSEEALKEISMPIEEIDYVIPHQANERILDGISKKLNISENKIVKTVNIHANTSAASIPLAMNYAFDKGIIKNGHTLLIQAIGAGLSWGASIIKLGKPNT